MATIEITDSQSVLAVFLIFLLNLAGIVRLVFNWPNFKYRWPMLILCLFFPFAGLWPLLARTDSQVRCDEQIKYDYLKTKFTMREPKTSPAKNKKTIQRTRK